MLPRLLPLRLLPLLGLAILPVPVAGPAGAQAAPPAPAPAFRMEPAGTPQPAAAPAAGVAPFVMDPTRPDAAAPAPAAPMPAMPAAVVPLKPALKPIARPIMPYERVQLEGEMDARTWTIWLTEEEAEQASTVEAGYTNAIVVMPEVSRLRIFVNDQLALETPIASSKDVARVTAPVQPGLLRPGANVVRIEAVHRHRTDCAVQATYELWTRLEGIATGFGFAGKDPYRLRRLDDLPAVGVAPTGVTTIRLIPLPNAEAASPERLLRLAQAVARRGSYPRPVVTIASTDAPPAGRGTLTVVAGTTADVAGAGITNGVAAIHPPPAGTDGPSFLEGSRFGPSTLVLAADNWGKVDASIARIAASAAAPRGERAALNTAAWLTPDVPLIRGERNLLLSDFGIRTQEFSGRRFRTRFSVAMPADFYAEAYGEAILHLDAAYSKTVRPGSHVDVYVNGQIAATMPITSRHGGLLRQFPLKIPMRHFKPGVNRLWLETVLDVEEDGRCLPSTMLAAANRFVLFDTTRLHVPQFGRIARRPSLGALAIGSFSSGAGDGPLPVILGQRDADTLGAAATLLARLATDTGRIVEVATSKTVAEVAARSALFVGPAADLSNGILAQAGVVESLRLTWRANAPVVDRGEPGEKRFFDAAVQRYRDSGSPASATEGTRDAELPTMREDDAAAIYDRWRDQLAGGGGLSGQIVALEQWLKRTFDLTFASFRLSRPVNTVFDPPLGTTMLIAQGTSPQGDGSWTVVTGRSPQALAEGMAHVTAPNVWAQVSGAAAAFQASSHRLQVQPVSAFVFDAPRDTSLGNLRLVVANWLSINIVPYAAALLVFCVLLGIATHLLLSRLGRRT